MIALLCALASCGSEVFVMCPLDMFNSNQELTYKSKLEGWFSQLAGADVDGVMIDVWWGLCETSSKSYKWSGYVTLFDMAVSAGLKIVPVMSFHKCGGNVGDSCDIAIPSFARSGSPYFKDSEGRTDDEYISFGWDDTSIGGRTPITMYKDFMSAFKSKFSSYISKGHIVEIEVGAGPCGELRYPGYQLNHGWQYPGCGAFQSYDSKLVANLKSYASNQGHSDWGKNPSNVGNQNVHPGGSAFWTEGASNSWNSDYGQFFITWYSKVLIDHGKKVLKAARSAFGSSTHLSTKIPGIHWWYLNSCHCAEITAGLKNFLLYDGYRDILSMFADHNIDCCFTCLEMTADTNYGSKPQTLVQQIADDCKWAGVKFEGENALECYDSASYNRIVKWVSKGLSRFTYLRLSDKLMSSSNFNTFKTFVKNMHNA